MPIPYYKPVPAPPGVFEGQPIPWNTAPLLSRGFFQWVSPLLKVGYSRPLQQEDLWEIPDEYKSKGIGDRLAENFQKRLPNSMRENYVKPNAIGSFKEGERNRDSNEEGSCHDTFVENDIDSDQPRGVQQPCPSTVAQYGKRNARETAKGKLLIEDGKEYDMSLFYALFHTFRYEWLLGVILRAVASTLFAISPLFTRYIIEQVTNSHNWHAAQASGESTNGLTPPKSIGYGVGLALCQCLLAFIGSVCQYQSSHYCQLVAYIMRTSTTVLVTRKTLRLSGRSKLQYTNGHLTTLVSADVNWLNSAGLRSADLFVSPFYFATAVALLIWTMGYSAFPGIGVLLIAGPLIGWVYTLSIKTRKLQVAFIDRRVRLLGEILGNIQAVKFFAYERVFATRIEEMRDYELSQTRTIGYCDSTLASTNQFIPILASVVTFITYSLSGHPLEPAIIFSGLQFFGILRSSLSKMPFALSALADCRVATNRIRDALLAEEVPPTINIDPEAEYGVEAHGSFRFDSAPDTNYGGQGEQEKCDMVSPVKPFALLGIDLKIPPGSLVCIVGRVGTGKTALLRGLINEMRQTSGSVKFNGPVSYVTQHPWIMAGSIRDNIALSLGKSSQPIDQARLDYVIDACDLRTDVEQWPSGDRTLIGERGIALSGGQRQRVSLARAAYNNNTLPSVVLLDDPLSSVDAHVGHHILHHCILSGPLATRTRILVTHQLDVLPYADIVLVLDRVGEAEGRIIQQGTYNELRAQPGVFRTLMDEFGSTADAQEEAEVAGHVESPSQTPLLAGYQAAALSSPEGVTKFLIDEERVTGATPWTVYSKYIQAMGSWGWFWLVGFLLILNQVAVVASTLFLGFWSAQSIPGWSENAYMGMYAGLGVLYMLSSLGSSFFMCLCGTWAGMSMFRDAWHRVMHAPMWWHDRTPTGRIINRMSKDVQDLDDRLAPVWNVFLNCVLQMFGMFGLIVYTLPYLSLVLVPLIGLAVLNAMIYRSSAQEMRRISSISRSQMYSALGEQLTGATVIRAFGCQDEFNTRMESAVDLQSQPYFFSVLLQRWLMVRIDLSCVFVVTLIAIIGVVFSHSVNPSRLGVVLTYSLTAVSAFAEIVNVYSQVEQEMNAVERVQHYTELEIEAAPVLPTDPGPEWPSRELDLVLRNVSFSVQPGEKIGVVGRTGAGKSSLAQALFRTVEIAQGKILVDDVDLGSIGLETLRQRLSIIPQETFLFTGSVRDNLDVLGHCTDAQLNDALNLIRNSPMASSDMLDKFTLDAQVLPDGSNFSAGEKQLLALICALVKGSKLLLLDEATSSVDPETDALIQRIIRREFNNVTLISIAHRLQTVVFYDRILVMDAGVVAEFDTPLALFDKPDSIFRGLCEQVLLSRDDIVRIRNDPEATMPIDNAP